MQIFYTILYTLNKFANIPVFYCNSNVTRHQYQNFILTKILKHVNSSEVSFTFLAWLNFFLLFLQIIYIFCTEYFSFKL